MRKFLIFFLAVYLFGYKSDRAQNVVAGTVTNNITTEQIPTVSVIAKGTKEPIPMTGDGFR